MKRTAIIILTISFALMAASTATTTAQNSENVRITPQLKAALQQYDHESWSFGEGEGLFIVSKNGYFGFINNRGEEVIPCKLNYIYCSVFNEGLAIVRGKNYKYGAINKKGEVVVPCKYDNINGFNEGVALVEINYKYGFINNKGKEIVPCTYDVAQDFQEGLALVIKNRKCGFINSQGKLVVPLIYDYANDFHDGLAVVGKNDNYGIINKNGDEVMPCSLYLNSHYNFLFSDFNNGVASFYTSYPEKKSGIVNSKGEVKFLTYDIIEAFHDGYAAVCCNDKWGFVNIKGEEVVSCKYDPRTVSYHAFFSNGLAPVCLNDKYGYVDTKGKLVVPFKYDRAYSFSDGMALVCRNDKWGYINSSGKEIIPCKYDVNHEEDFCHIGDSFFSNGIAVVYSWSTNKITTALIDKYGNTTFSNSGNKKTGGAKKQRKTFRCR